MTYNDYYDKELEKALCNAKSEQEKERIKIFFAMMNINNNLDNFRNTTKEVKK